MSKAVASGGESATQDLKYLRNEDLRREIMDMVGGSAEQLSRQMRDSTKKFKADEIGRIAQAVGADTLADERSMLAHRVMDTIGLLDDRREESDQDDRRHANRVIDNRENLKVLHRYLAENDIEVGPSWCGRLREMARDRPPGELSEEVGRTPRTVRRHVQGRCDCETIVLPIDPDLHSERATQDMCVEWRRRVRYDGEPQSAIVAESHASKNMVSRHVRGACGHNEDDLAEPPIESSGSSVSDVLCAEIRRRAREGESAPSIAEDERMPSKSTVRRHRRGDCPHEDVGEEPVEVADG